MAKTKRCPSCGKRKAESKFATRSDNGKLRSQCRDCISKGVRIPKK